MDSIPEKKCTCCKEPFPPTTEYFHRDKAKKDGLATECKACSLAKARIYYQSNSEAIKERSRKWRLENTEQHRQYSKQWKEEHPQEKQEATDLYRTRHPEKNKAHKAVQRAIERGELVRVSNLVCVDCGKQAQEYHHPDYSKPLEVFPLCRVCHNKRHPK